MNIRILSEKYFNIAMLWAVLLILVIPVGIANVYLGYVLGESPCTLCWYERFGMITIGFLGLFMVVYGPKFKYIASVFLCAAYGLYMTIRHYFLFYPGDIGTGQAGAIFGAHTYTWGIFVYWAVVIVMSLLLLCIKHEDKNLMDDLTQRRNIIKPITKFGKIVFALTFLVTASNGIQALFTNGLPPNGGKHYPDRWTTSLEYTDIRMQANIWKRLTKPGSFTGANKIEDPMLPGISEPTEVKFNLNATDGAFLNLKAGPKLVNTKELPFKAYGIFNEGNAAGISYNARMDEFAIVNNRGGIWFTDNAIQNVKTHAVMDLVNGLDTKWLADCSFIEDKLFITAWNKNIMAVEKAPKAQTHEEKYWEWTLFRETDGDLKMTWGWERWFVLTDRARSAYVTSMAAAEDNSGYYMINVPNRVTKKLVLMKVHAVDHKLSEEAYLKVDNKLLKEGRNINDYYVTGMVSHKGKLLAYSMQYNTLLVVDPVKQMVVDAYDMPKELTKAHSMTIKGNAIFMLGREGNKDIVFEMTLPDTL